MKLFVLKLFEFLQEKKVSCITPILAPRAFIVRFDYFFFNMLAVHRDVIFQVFGIQLLKFVISSLSSSVLPGFVCSLFLIRPDGVKAALNKLVVNLSGAESAQQGSTITVTSNLH